MKVIIAEKPEVRRAIVETMGGGEDKGGYHIVKDYAVTNCYGHMLELVEPLGKSKWEWETLPFNNKPGNKIVSEDKNKQYSIIAKLIEEADEIIHAGDPDEEGQLIVDEILVKEGIIEMKPGGKVTKPVKRLLINDNTPEKVREALNNMDDNKNHLGMSLAAEARSVADQLYGLNLSRAYSLAGQAKGYQGVLSVGRVQTPILGLVVRRDLEIESHTKRLYYVVSAVINGVSAKYIPVPADGLDEKNRIAAEETAKEIVAGVQGQQAILETLKTVQKKTPAPLPYNLLALQVEAADKHGYKADKVLDITQRLREKKLITYNRSDCQYLSEVHFTEASAVIDIVMQNLSAFSNIQADLNLSVKGRAFNDSNVTAHHAIIPTKTLVNTAELKEDELTIYKMICARYLLQFAADYEFEHTDAAFKMNNRVFSVSSNTPIKFGWKDLQKTLGSVPTDTENEGEEESPDLKSFKEGCSYNVEDAGYKAQETKPRPRYTDSSLLADLTHVADYVENETIKKLLKEKDEGKKGEHGGIGTPATRSNIIKILFDRGFLENKGKQVISTESGRQFYSALPQQAVYPDMTALWHEEQKAIQRNEKTIESFLTDVYNYVATEVARVKHDGLDIKSNAPDCPTCGKPLRRMQAKDKKSHFWGCTGYPDCKQTYPDKGGNPDFPKQGGTCPKCGKGELIRKKGSNGYFWSCNQYPECKQTYPDKSGKPDLEHKAAFVSEIHKCLNCGKGLVRRQTKDKKSHFWGCSGYPQCKQTYPDNDGKPNFNAKKGG